MADRIKIIVSQQEFDTIMAALRAYQTLLEQNSAICQDVEDIAEEHGSAMEPAEIDALCERINCEALTLSRRVPA